MAVHLERRGILRASINVVRVLVGVSLLLLLLIFSESGGILNRCRGGFADLSSVSYWPRHEISRELFSFFTGLLVVREILYGLCI